MTVDASHWRIRYSMSLRAQRGVRGDENGANLRERELQDDPFGDVASPTTTTRSPAPTPSAMRPRPIDRASASSWAKV